MSAKYADEMTNSVGPDQTAVLKAKSDLDPHCLLRPITPIHRSFTVKISLRSWVNSQFTDKTAITGLAGFHFAN